MKLFRFWWLCLVMACPTPLGVPGVIDCTKEAVRDHAIALIPLVNDCLTTPSDWRKCLAELVNPAAGVTAEAVACAVQSRGRSYAFASRANSTDKLSAAAASRAQQYIDVNGYKFKE